MYGANFALTSLVQLGLGTVAQRTRDLWPGYLLPTARHSVGDPVRSVPEPVLCNGRSQGDITHIRGEVMVEEVFEPSRRAPILRRFLEFAPGARGHVPKPAMGGTKVPTSRANGPAPSCGRRVRLLS